ncbi:unnamed protein product [Amoebophrya sp. A25]|nr:unnamed protein product [Amoebophrya sp. A25]|eukprot:GSA25T00009329001.1
MFDDLDVLLGETAALGESAKAKKNPRPRGNDKAKEGWGFGASSSVETKKKDDPAATSLTATQESQDTLIKTSSKHDSFDDGPRGDAIPTIPDLEDNDNDDLTEQIAAPPIANDARFFQSLRDLEKDSAEKKLLYTSAQQGVDLAALMSVMTPYQQVCEADDVWDYGFVFQEVVTHVNQITQDKASTS